MLTLFQLSIATAKSQLMVGPQLPGTFFGQKGSGGIPHIARYCRKHLFDMQLHTIPKQNAGGKPNKNYSSLHNP
jgi:hypothetical protein